jgi:ActR/RegA family two-component response regulator
MSGGIVRASVSLRDNESLRVLIVDNQAQQLNPLVGRLRMLGHQVETMESSAAALSRAQQLHPLCSVVEMNLGAESGLDLVRELKALDPLNRVIICSCQISKGVLEQAMLAGAQGYLEKPLDAEGVISKLRHTPRASGYATDGLTLHQLIHLHIERTIERHGGSIAAAARSLGVSRQALHSRLRKSPYR